MANNARRQASNLVRFPEAPAKALSGFTKRARAAGPSSRRGGLFERFLAGDYDMALAIGETLLSEDPHDSVARDFVEECRCLLEQRYVARLGSLRQIPKLFILQRELASLPVDHEACRILACVDGMSTVETLLDVSPLERLETLRIFDDLVSRGFLALDPLP